MLGVLFLGRIDRTVLMQGFQTWDPGKLNYLLGVFHVRTHARTQANNNDISKTNMIRLRRKDTKQQNAITESLSVLRKFKIE